MTNTEFSDTFDTLLNSYSITANYGEEASKQVITLDEYEKSVFLSKAQEEVVLEFYTGKNSFGDSFESTEEVRRYLSNLVTERYLKPITNSNGIPLGVSSTSKFFTLPEGLWFLTLELAVVDNSKCKRETYIKVYPVKQDEYQNIKDNPFRGANYRRALRLDLSEGNVEIICKYQITAYYIRYIKKVHPIILETLPEGLTIGGKSEASECELHEALHHRILDRAVQLALQSKGYTIQRENK